MKKKSPPISRRTLLGTGVAVAVSGKVALAGTQAKQEKTAAVYNSDGSLKTEAVWEDVAVQNPHANYTAQIWKDKSVRDAIGKYNQNITTVNGSFTMGVGASAKNPVVQAYTAMKAEEAWKDYTDV